MTLTIQHTVSQETRYKVKERDFIWKARGPRRRQTNVPKHHLNSELSVREMGSRKGADQEVIEGCRRLDVSKSPS